MVMRSQVKQDFSLKSWLKPLVFIMLALGGFWSSGVYRVTAQPAQDGGALTVRSDIQEANSETGIVTARGNVQVYYPARNIQGTSVQAQYFSKEQRLVMTGNVYVLQEGNSIRAENITYLIEQDRFIATPRTTEQVESIYIVPESDNTASTAPANNTAITPGAAPAPIPNPAFDTNIDPALNTPLPSLLDFPEDATDGPNPFAPTPSVPSTGPNPFDITPQN